MGDHSALVELIHHLDDHLTEVRSAEPDWYSWSDGDKLRGLAHNQLAGQHVMAHVGIPIDLQYARDLLRIAARLDILDELEAKEAAEEEG